MSSARQDTWPDSNEAICREWQEVKGTGPICLCESFIDKQLLKQEMCGAQGIGVSDSVSSLPPLGTEKPAGPGDRHEQGARDSWRVRGRADQEKLGLQCRDQCNVETGSWGVVETSWQGSWSSGKTPASKMT